MKKLDMTPLKNSVTFYIALAMLGLTLVTVFTTAYVQNHRANIEQEKYNKQIHLGIEHVIKHYIRDYGYRVRRMLETPKIEEYIKNRDREALYREFKPKWDLMLEEEKNLQIMHFHLADGSSFLRMHKPELYGDNLISVRPMIKEIHTEHKKINGYETGKYGTSYRIIYPIFDDKSGEYLGAFEIGLNPKFILSAISKINGFCGMMFIRENALTLYSTPNDTVIDGYKLQSELSAQLKKICGVLELPNKLEDKMELVVGDKSYQTHLFILNDYKNKPTVKIIFFQDTTDFGIYRSYILIALFLSLFIILLGLIWLVYRRMGSYEDEVSAIYKNQIQQLNDSEHRFELLYEKAPEAYQSLDIDGNINIVNLKWLEDLGYGEEEVIGKNFGDFLAPGFGEKFKENFPKFKEAGGIVSIEFDMLRKDGEIITAIYNGKVVRDDMGKFLQTHCVFTNITEQKRVREDISNSQKYLKAIFDISSNIMIINNEEKIETVNPAMLSFFAYESLEDFNDKHDCICDFFIKGDECLESEVDGVNWLEYVLKYKNRLNRVCMLKNGKKHNFTIEAHTLNIDESKRSIVFFNDVTEIEEIGRRLEYAVKGVNDGLWDWNLEENSIYFSPRWKEMLGYSDRELMNVTETWRSRVHPDDLDNAVKDMEKSQSAPDIEYKNTHKLRHKDGHWVWVLSRGQTIFDNSGKAVRMVGFHTDITEIKELETQLRENEQVYYDFFEHTKSANIMYETDDDGKSFKIKTLNSLVEKLEGVKKEDIVGKRVEDVFEGVEEFGLLDIFRDVYKTGTPKKMAISFYVDEEVTVWRENYIFKLSNGDIVASYEDRTKEKELEVLLHNTINSVENLIFVKDADFRYLECNGAFENFIGHSKDELIGKDDYDFFDKGLADKFRAKDVEMFNREGSAESLEWTTFSDGREVYLYTILNPLRNEDGKAIGLVGNAVDLTKQKRLEDELRSAKQEFEKFMEYVPASILIKDENLRITYANSKAKSFFNGKDIVGLKAEDLLSAEDIVTVNNIDARILEENSVDEVAEYTYSDNEKRVSRTMGFVIEDEGRNKIGTIIVDITHEHEMKEELHNKEELMIAQSRHAAMGEMISMIAHQWRQPISVISMDANNILADIELETIEEKTLKSASEDILKQTQELSKTIDDFRNFFRPEKEAQEVVVKELFDDALAVIGKSLENSQVEFTLEIDENKKITTYSRELMQVFINIIKNAKEALVDKGVNNKKISIFTKEDKEYFTLRICDNAGGVKVENMENIFDPYFTTKGEKNGTGLGLYMSKTIVEKHLQGSLSVENNGEGACFIISLPFTIS